MKRGRDFFEYLIGQQRGQSMCTQRESQAEKLLKSRIQKSEVRIQNTEAASLFLILFFF